MGQTGTTGRQVDHLRSNGEVNFTVVAASTNAFGGFMYVVC